MVVSKRDYNSNRSYVINGTTRYYRAEHTNYSRVHPTERDAWINIADDTVIVFGHGDSGHNSENGMVRIYSAFRFPEGVNPGTNTGNYNFLTQQFDEDDYLQDVAWADSGDVASGTNLGSVHGRLGLASTTLAGSMLTVIALDDRNRIWKYSNGCGNAKNFCIGAPGVDIKVAIPGTGTAGYRLESGTALAAAHVAGAVAVLAGAFPDLSSNELQSVILNSTDDLGIEGVDEIYGFGALNLARATEPLGTLTMTSFGSQRLEGITLGNSGITLPTSFGGALDGFTVGFLDDYNRPFIGNPGRITRESVAFTLADTLATWDSPALQSIALDSNSKMQFSNYDASAGTRNTLMFTHKLPNHVVGFSYKEAQKSPDFRLTDAGDNGNELHFQKIRPIASDLMQLNSTHKLGKKLTVKNAITSAN